MKVNGPMTTTAGLMAVGLAWWKHRTNRLRSREVERDSRCLREALDTFEGEGGLVLS